jgi:hypothetical protein
MITKILGGIDLFGGIIIIINFISSLIPQKFLLFLGLIILIKGVSFSITLNFASIGDIVSGILIVVMAFAGTPFFIILIISIFLIQKGIVSFF